MRYQETAVEQTDRFRMHAFSPVCFVFALEVSDVHREIDFFLVLHPHFVVKLYEKLLSREEVAVE